MDNTIEKSLLNWAKTIGVNIWNNNGSLKDEDTIKNEILDKLRPQNSIYTFPDQYLRNINNVDYFSENKLIIYLVDQYGDLNKLSCYASQKNLVEEYKQLMQLMGYSIDGYYEICRGLDD
jgi:hypothetical protein